MVSTAPTSVGMPMRFSFPLATGPLPSVGVALPVAGPNSRAIGRFAVRAARPAGLLAGWDTCPLCVHYSHAGGPPGEVGAGNTLTDETVSPSGVNELAQRWRSHRANAAADSLDRK